jgi:hypothetical protein
MSERRLFIRTTQSSSGYRIPLFLLVGAMALSPPVTRAQESCDLADAFPTPARFLEPENPDDPAYETYREGYNLILEENWEAARKKLQQVIAKYPKSSFVDDAEYWIAYSFRETSRSKATELYRQFLERYPRSSYYDDAVAELNQLQLQAALARLPHTPRSPDAQLEFRVQTKMPEELRRLEQQLQQLHSVTRRQMDRTFVLPSFRGDSLIELKIPVLRYSFGPQNLDPHLRVRVDALRALSEAHDDARTFHTLREVAVDQQQPLPLRQTAMESLTGFTKFDVGSVYFEIARRDTNEELQAASVEYLARSGKDRGKSLEALIELFNAVPPNRTRQLGTTLFAIAEIGDDRATDFLIRVARGHQNFEMRSDAVYYLGNIGSDRARKALQEILMDR